MGKRSSFERREADFYPTPRAAVVPLIPHLRGIRSFAEPCAGDGDAIITNPPYTRDLMHRLIAHFQHIAPTWLLLDSDWANTLQAAPLMPSCTDIMPIGRVKWFAGTKHTGNDNYAWYRFDARHTSGPVFHGRCGDYVTPVRRTGICEHCRKVYAPQRPSSRFCSETCRQRAHRNRVSVTSSVTVASSKTSEVFRYVRHADVPKFRAEGWELLPALDGTRHVSTRR